MSDFLSASATRKPDKSFSHAPRALAAWRQSLPRANVQTLAREVFKTLEMTNATTYRPQDRFRILKTIHATLNEVMPAIEKKFLNPSSRANDAIDRLATLSVEFYRQMAIGFRQVSHDLNNAGKIPILHRTMYRTAVYQLIWNLGRILRINWVQYRVNQDGLWHEIHWAYIGAREMEILDKTCDLLEGQKKPGSIEKLYKQILITATTNTNRLAQRDMIQIMTFLDEWLPDCKIHTASTPEAVPPGSFAYSERGDWGPKQLVDIEDKQEGVQWLDLGVQIKALEALIENPEKQPAGLKKEQMLEPRLLQALHAEWTSVAEREHKRLPADYSASIAVGLPVIHYFLAGEKDFADYVNELDHDELSSHISENEPGWLNNNTRSTPALKNAAIIDQSLGGYCIRLPTDSERVQVGALLAIKQDDAEHAEADWILGVIRWLKSRDNGQEAGVQLLSRNVVAVAALAPSSSARKTTLVRGLLLNSNESDELPASLIVPNHVDACAEMQVTSQEKFEQGVIAIKKVQTKRKLEATSSFTQVDFNLLESRNESGSLATEVSAEDLDDLWASLSS